MNNAALDMLRTTNREFQEFIDLVTRNGPKAVASRGGTRRLGAISQRLKQVGEHLGSESSAMLQAPETRLELRRYAENLRTLRSVMQTVQLTLLAEKGRLENARVNLQAACAWASSLRQIS